jgi:hypothetical protein
VNVNSAVRIKSLNIIQVNFRLETLKGATSFEASATKGLALRCTLISRLRMQNKACDHEV